MWKQRLREFIDASERYQIASGLFRRSERLAWKHLAKRVGNDLAYIIAGVGLADVRSLKAWQRRRKAFEALLSALDGNQYYTQHTFAAARRCLWQPAANDNHIN